MINGRDLVYCSSQDPLNSVYQCRVCGLVYKPIFNTSAGVNVDNTYQVESWEVNYDVHLSRMNRVVEYAKKFNDSLCAQPILDVGAGIGLLYDALECGGGGNNYVAIEPVTPIAEHLSGRFPDILVLNASVQRCAIPRSYFGSAFVLGVDYLFEDIDKAFSNISSSLIEDGMLFVERNVFIDQRAYVGNIIRTQDDMFAANTLIRNWFHHEQYEHYLSKHFEVVESLKNEYLITEDDSQETMFSYIYACRKPKTNNISWIHRAYISENTNALVRLGRSGE